MYNHKIIINKTKKYKKLIQDLYKFYITNKINIPTSWIKSTYKDNNVEKFRSNNLFINIRHLNYSTNKMIINNIR